MLLVGSGRVSWWLMLPISEDRLRLIDRRMEEYAAKTMNNRWKAILDVNWSESTSLSMNRKI